MKSRLALILFVSTLIFAGNQVGAQIQVTQSAGAKLTNQGSTTVDFVLDPRDNPNEQHKLYSISEQATGTYVAAASGSYICDVPAQLVLDPGPYTFAMGSLGGNSFDVLANGGEQHVAALLWQAGCCGIRRGDRRGVTDRRAVLHGSCLRVE